MSIVYGLYFRRKIFPYRITYESEFTKKKEFITDD